MWTEKERVDMESSRAVADGIHCMLPRQDMTESARVLRDIYAVTPGPPFFKREFGFFGIERWKEQGMPKDVPPAELFDFDPPAVHYLAHLGWCESAFEP